MISFNTHDIFESRIRQEKAIMNDLNNKMQQRAVSPTATASTPGGFVRNKHSHYFKDVAHLNSLDVYRVLELFNVTNPSIAHATKKLLVAGGRGAGKSIDKDIQEAIDSLLRWQAMRNEDRSQDDGK